MLKYHDTVCDDQGGSDCVCSAGVLSLAWRAATLLLGHFRWQLNELKGTQYLKVHMQSSKRSQTSQCHQKLYRGVQHCSLSEMCVRQTYVNVVVDIDFRWLEQ